MLRELRPDKGHIIPSPTGAGQALLALGLLLALGACRGRDGGDGPPPAPPSAIPAEILDAAGQTGSSAGGGMADRPATLEAMARAEASATSARATAEVAPTAAYLATAAAALASASDRAAGRVESTPGGRATPAAHAPAADASAMPEPPGSTALRPEGLAPPPAAAETAAAHRLPGVAHTWQKWNNCGPSSIAMTLSLFGLRIDQLEAAARLKPDREDTNVSPEELADYARGQGLRSRVFHGGDLERLRRLLRAGLPVLAEQWIAVEGRGEMGHYRVVTGYDDAAGAILAQDSYYGPDRSFAYGDFEAMWRPFLGAYVLVWLPEQEAALREALGADWDEAAMWQRVLAEQEAWAAAEPGSAWAHFALGEARSRLGDHAGAVAAFDRARAIGLPFRAFWYQFGYYRSLFATGDFERMVALADETLAPMRGENLEESQYWKGRALEALGRREEALVSYRRALEFNPLFAAAAEALARAGG